MAVLEAARARAPSQPGSSGYSIRRASGTSFPICCPRPCVLRQVSNNAAGRASTNAVKNACILKYSPGRKAGVSTEPRTV